MGGIIGWTDQIGRARGLALAVIGEIRAIIITGHHIELGVKKLEEGIGPVVEAPGLDGIRCPLG